MKWNYRVSQLTNETTKNNNKKNKSKCPITNAMS